MIREDTLPMIELQLQTKWYERTDGFNIEQTVRWTYKWTDRQRKNRDEKMRNKSEILQRFRCRVEVFQLNYIGSEAKHFDDAGSFDKFIKCKQRLENWNSMERQLNEI